MAQPPCIGLSWPLTNPPFGGCAIYFHYGVLQHQTLGKPHESYAISKASVGVTLRPSVTALLVRTTWEILGGLVVFESHRPNSVICWCFFFGFLVLVGSHAQMYFNQHSLLHKQKSFGGSQSYLVENESSFSFRNITWVVAFFKYFLEFSPRTLGKDELTSIFFKWVGSTTN